MRRLLYPLVLCSLVSPASASPVTFGASWDGSPPGTFADISGAADIMSGHPDFAAGMYLVSITGGYSAMYTQDTIGLEGDTVCATSATGCALGKPSAGQTPTVLQVYLDRPWHLWGWSPAIGKSVSTGPQFAWTQVSATVWSFGYEDLSLVTGDADYQDVLGTVTFVHGMEPDPTPDPPTVVPTPEPAGLGLVGVSLVVAAQMIRRRR